MIDQVKKIIESETHSLAVARWGVAPLERPLSLDIYESWLQQGHHGEMRYLETHVPAKSNPKELLRTGHTAIVFAIDYIPHPRPGNALSSLNIARYACGEDYHHWLKHELNQIIAQLKNEFPEEDFVSMTDSSPVLERDLAHRAGLGWFGKNTCLIDKKAGSFFLIGEIYTSLQLPQSSQSPPTDHCGTCRRCIDACPTQALNEDRTMDARKCISYLTIEKKVHPSDSTVLYDKVGDCFFGCDICQNVCPWNIKRFGEKPLKTSEAKKNQLLVDLQWVLESSNKSLIKSLMGSPLARAGGNGLKRNAMIVAANLGLVELRQQVKAFSDHEKLRSVAQWALDRLSDEDSAQL